MTCAYARRPRVWVRYPARHAIGGQWYRTPQAVWVTDLERKLIGWLKHRIAILLDG